MMKTLIRIVIIFLFLSKNVYALTGYFTPEEFSRNIITNYSWGFENLKVGTDTKNNVRGPGSINLIKGLVGDLTGYTDYLHGKNVYFNPQSPLGMFNFSSKTTTAFAFNFIWSDINRDGTGFAFYDYNNNEIGSFAFTPENALGSEIINQYYLFYQGFLGVQSEVPIYRVAITKDHGGSVDLDDLVWYENYVPTSEQGTPKPPKSPQSPKPPKSPIATKVSNFDSLFLSSELETSDFSIESESPPSTWYLSEYSDENIPRAVNPEPLSIFLLGGGLAGAFIRKQRKERMVK